MHHSDTPLCHNLHACQEAETETPMETTIYIIGTVIYTGITVALAVMTYQVWRDEA